MRWGIVIARRDVASFGRIEIRHENMMTNIDAPLVPMTERQSGEQAYLDGVLLLRVMHPLVAGIVIAFGIGVYDEGCLFAVRRHNHRPLHTAADPGDLL